jgi:hypothetical protein
MSTKREMMLLPVADDDDDDDVDVGRSFLKKPSSS